MTTSDRVRLAPSDRFTPFFDVPGARWDRPEGRLHAYLLLPDGVADVLGRAADAVAELLPVQPMGSLHLTVAQFPWYESDLSDVSLARLGQDLGRAVGGCGPLEVVLDPPVVTATGVVVPARVTGWHGLTLSASRLRVPGRTGVPVTTEAPHVTLAYAVEPVVAGPVAARVARVRAQWRPLRFAVDTAYLVPVTQGAESGTFTWPWALPVRLSGAVERDPARPHFTRCA